MIPLAEARRLLLEATPVLDPIEVPAAEALGLGLAEAVLADRDLPPTDRSAMDGFAVRTADLPRPGEVLAVATTLRAGQSAAGIRVEPGQAVRLFTGSVVPEGADAVVMVELTEEGEGGATVRIRERPEPGQHISRRGEDVGRGDAILAPGSPLHAAELAALSSVGRTRVRVFRPPKVHILSTGDEVVEPHAAPAVHQVRNSNATALQAQLRELHLSGSYLGIVTDTAEALDEALARGLAADVLLLTGGVSVGAFDLVTEALTRAGMTTLFHGVAVRPGRPMLAGTRAGCLVAALPGNPVSTFTTFALLVAPALRKMMGLRRWDALEVDALLHGRLRRTPGRATYALARVEPQAVGWSAVPVRTSGSGDVVALARANAFVSVDEGRGAVESGTSVRAILWRDAQLR
jgi:molybdopterin molybdotransferase